MKSIAAAIAHYEDLLSAPGMRESTRDFLMQEMRVEKMIFEKGPLSPYLRPYFISSEKWKRIQDTCDNLWKAIEKVGNALVTSTSLQAEIGLTSQEKELIDIDPGFSKLCFMGRFDSYLSEHSQSFFELNTESTGSISYNEVMANIYLESPIFKEFTKRFSVEKLPSREPFFESFLKTYREWDNSSYLPNIAIIDMPNASCYTEFEQFQDFFKTKGINTIITDPYKLRYDGKKLYCGDFPIDLIYRRLLLNDYLKILKDAKPLLEAYHDNNVCVIGSFRAKYLHKKMLFGIMTNDAHAHLFSKEERELIQKHIPWTRRMAKVRSVYEAHEGDLIDFVRKNKNDLILKPNDEYGGKGIYIGWEIDNVAWEDAINNALESDYIVQKRVCAPHFKFPTFDSEGIITSKDFISDFNPYIFDGKTTSALVRLSTNSISNINQGGGLLPVFVVKQI